MRPEYSLNQTCYVSSQEWVKWHPIFALVGTSASNVELNMIASIIFEKAKRVLPWLG
jgi:hypothetical protein